jgi:hypothetical protein
MLAETLRSPQIPTALRRMSRYWMDILGQWPPLPVVRAAIEAAALTVPEVVTAQCTIASFVDRQITGQVIVTTSSGTTQTVSF